MKKMLMGFLCFLLFTVPAYAFLYEVQALSKEELKKLSNEQLTDVYTDAVIERRATEVFFTRAGLTPKEYAQFKDLLKFIVRLRQEMVERKIDVPPIEDWVK
ncbi:MAG: hypothetical protein HQL23_08290 [Candidatus Omnitrophica bacterium]|nr:hypothetical protein [Candidatus Omnitrophota bacterium]